MISWTYGKASINQFSKAQKSLIHISCQKVKVGLWGFFSPKALGSLIKNATADFTRSGSLWGTFFPSEVVCWLGPSSVSLWTNSLSRSCSDFQNWWTRPHNSWSSTHLKREIKKENFVNRRHALILACFSFLVKTQGLESIQRNQKLINLHPPLHTRNNVVILPQHWWSTFLPMKRNRCNCSTNEVGWGGEQFCQRWGITSGVVVKCAYVIKTITHPLNNFPSEIIITLSSASAARFAGWFDETATVPLISFCFLMNVAPVFIGGLLEGTLCFASLSALHAPREYSDRFHPQRGKRLF